MLKCKKGFTLVEVLVALIIFSFSMATIYWGYSQAIKNSKKAIDLISTFNNVNNFFILNKKFLKENDEENFEKDGFIIKKTPLSVMINDSFKLEDDKIFVTKIKEKDSNYEFKYIITK